jgi:nitroreductase
MFYSAMHTGYISQNIYLYCASQNLVTVAVGWLKRDAVSKLLKLNKEQKVMLVQPVGYPLINK